MKSEPEIILNLWYVYDELGMIYKLLARAYVRSGTDEEKQACLRQFAETDYMLAQWFPVPERFHTTIIEGEEKRKMAVVGIDSIESTVGFAALFEDTFQQLEKEFPPATKLRIPRDPLICITPLFADHNGEFHPKTGKRGRL